MPLPKRGLNGPQDVPDTWKRALREVQKMFPGAVLAGGALRDRDAGVKVKDLDIFIEAVANNESALRYAAKLMEDTGLQADVIDTTIYARWFGVTRILGIIETKFTGAPPVQLIFVNFKTDEDLLGRFDFGVCQIMFDGSVIKKTDAYDSDFRWKRYRLVTECDHEQLVRRMERWSRLREKYPDWKLDFGIMSPEGSLGRLSDQVVRTMHGV